MDELPWGDETLGVATAGDGVPGEGGRGQGGDETPPTTQATEARGSSGGVKARMGRPRTAAPPRPQQGTAADTNSAGTPPRHTSGTAGARLKHGVLARHEYGLLAPPGAVVDPSDTGEQDSRDGHESTGERADQSRRETAEGEENRQRALLARGMRGVDDEEQRPPNQLRVLNACGCQGGESGGGPPTQQRAPMAHSQGPGGDHQTR